MYIGRFAPSPSGPLHFGSLIAALGSYFQAKANQGKWLVRIEDIDPPREMPGADKLILNTLEAYHLYWDEDVLYQSDRLDAYQQQLDQWLNHNQAYLCQCTRKQIKASGGFYQGVCRDKHLTNAQECAIRLVMNHPVESFDDEAYGTFAINRDLAHEDFIIKRRDGLFAYNLAVVLDDIYQGVTEVVRGADLIEPTGRQISLYKTLDKTPISYVHLPLALDDNGNKLSKQNHAKAIDTENPKKTLLEAMRFLGFTIDPSLCNESMDNILDWGVKNWHLSQLPKTLKIKPPFSNGAL
ncbi:tRNA glutamyl-Q(34) synthetase GluQRS [Vibrio hippocampi]|uniref:Glutamyl-Q tRNA(Asp) synthetase n=1 Tax=Vibrio hippocampi TaxID=654686 RepID=A0ABN8DJY4_9VIBR|nr:tRNA glutamyl-Q(34) synthetase GluQRS [Vibrio hippocampi]CAH0527108.1 Glutamyl-Q tRNA(Asp) synthetase [Vibrio hippocampi]